MLARIWGYGKGGEVEFWACLLLSFVSRGPMLLIPALTGLVIDRVKHAYDVGTPPEIAWPALGVVLVTIGGGLCAYGEMLLGNMFAQTVLRNIRQHFYEHLTRQSFRFFDRVRSGELMARATSDVERVGFLAGWGFRLILKNVVMFVVVLVICLAKDAKLAAISLATMPLLSYSAAQLGIKMRPVFEEARQELAKLTSMLSENIQGVRVVRIYNRERQEMERFAKQSGTYRDRTFQAAKIDAWYSPLTSFWGALGLIAVLWYGGKEVIEGRISLGEFVAFQGYIMQLMVPLRFMGWAVSAAVRAVTAARRAFAILDEEPLVKDLAAARELAECRGEVIFDNVTFSYNGHEVLRGVSLEIPAGKTVGVLGATGSGKSTLVSLIPRFYDVTGGQVLIDGQDVRQLRQESLRRHIGFVFQDTFLFGESLRNNVAYGRPNAEQEEVERAAQQAALHNFVSALEQGYDVEVGERGMMLSGGQRQRVAIARALLVNPRILILDDCTSNVDTYTEHLIQQALAKVAEGRTVLIVSQRPSAIALADEVVVLEDGKVAEHGAPEELAAQPDSLFVRLMSVEKETGADSGDGRGDRLLGDDPPPAETK